jgi:hypothetical protein
MKSKLIALLLLLVLLATSALWSQAKPAAAGSTVINPAQEPAAAQTESGLKKLDLSPFWIQLVPSLTIPLGQSGQYFALGGDGTLTGEYRLLFFPMASARLGLEYGYNPLVISGSVYMTNRSVSLTGVSAGVGISYNFIPNLGLKAYADGGATFRSSIHRAPFS